LHRWPYYWGAWGYPYYRGYYYPHYDCYDPRYGRSYCN
jgi:hypothetical protein